MAGRHVLIDGYNVIRADPALSQLELRSMEEARDALTRSVASWPRFLGDRVSIVFDGAAARSFVSSHRFGHVNVVFSSAPKSADDYIKAVVADTRTPDTVVVVSNDRDIQEFCSSRGCSVTGSENLLVQLRSPHNVRRPKLDHDDQNMNTGVGTTKKGNPRRLPKRRRGSHDVRF